MSKMDLHDPFGYLKHKLWPKEKLGIKLPIWLLTTKRKFVNLPDLLTCRWRVTYHWKALDKGYNFYLDLTSIRGLHTKLWASKVVGVSILGISKLPLGSPATKWHLGVGPMARHIIYYKGEGGGFPQVWAMVSLVSMYLPVVRPCLPVARPCTKNVQTKH